MAAMKSGRAATRFGAARRVAVQPAQRREVDELDHRRDHDRRQRRLRQLLEQAGQQQQRDDRQRGDDQPGELRSCAPAPPLTAVLDRLPLTTIPLDRPAPRLARAEAEQLAVGVDLVVLARGVGLRRAQPLGEADEHHPDAAGDQRAVVGQARRRAARSPAGRRRSHRRCRRRRRRGRTATSRDAEQHRRQRARDDRRHAPQPEHDRQRGPARPRASGRRRRPAAHHVPGLLEEVALALLDRPTASGPGRR